MLQCKIKFTNKKLYNKDKSNKLGEKWYQSQV